MSIPESFLRIKTGGEHGLADFSLRMDRSFAMLHGFLFLMVFAAATAQAAPFAKRIQFQQPDGTAITLWGEGDEFRAVFETLDGYTVVFDHATKAYNYAMLSAGGDDLVSAGLQVGQGSPKAMGLPQHLRINPQTVKARARAKRIRWEKDMDISRRWSELKAARQAEDEARRAGVPPPAPPASTTTGTKIGLCLLIDFDDDPATIGRAAINNYCNGDSYTGYGNNGSVKKYFQDISDGLLTYSNVVTVYIRIPNSLHKKSWYNDTTKVDGDQANLLIRDAITVMKALPNYASEILPTFSNLTVDGANYVTACNVFYAGGDGGVWGKGLWPHSWVLYNVGAQSLSAGGKKIYAYQITGIGSSLELGTFCHENGHMLCDFPDIYDYDYDSEGGAGVFCLMNSGGFGGNPVQVCAYLKRAAGWTTITELTSASSLTATLTSSAGASFNHFYRYAKPGVPTEYFLAENRQKAGRDANIAAAGIAIWHVDELGDRDNQSTTPNSSHANYEVTLEQADNQWHFQNKVNSGDANDLYYSANSAASYNNQFTDTSSPNAHWWDGTVSGINFRNFSSSATTMTFLVGGSTTMANDACSGAAALSDNVYYSEDTSTATGDTTPGRGTIDKGVWFTFIPSVSGTATVDTCTSDFDTVIEVMSGSCGALATIANNDDGSCSPQSSLTFTCTAGVTYRICAGGYSGDSGNLKIRAHAVGVGSGLANDACSGAAALSDNVYYSEDTSTAAGDTTPGRGTLDKGVWFAFTPSISGEVTVDTCTSDFDTIIEVMSGSCGALTWIADNDDGSCGLQSSLSFMGAAGITYRICAGGYSGDSGALKIRAHAAGGSGLPNDACSGAVALSENVYHSATTTAATTDTTPGRGTIGKGVWFTYTPVLSGVTTVDTCSSDFDTVIEVMSGSCGALTWIADNDDGTCGFQSSLSFACTAGVTYRICAGGYSGDSGALNIRACTIGGAGLANDSCAGAAALGENTYYSENTTAATGGDSTPGRGTIGKGVWFTYTPSASGMAMVDTCPSDYDTVIEVMRGSCGALTTIANNDDGSCGLQSSLRFACTAGVTYRICAGGYGNQSGNLRLRARRVSAANDYNGDGVSDLPLFNPPDGAWFIQTVAGQGLAWANRWGWSTAKPVVGDYNGDSKWDQAVFDTAGGYWYIKSLSGSAITWKNHWGWSTATPVPGDYDGDGKWDLAVFDTAGGYWYIKSLSGSTITWKNHWGWSTATPVPGDYDGDGKWDLAVFDTAGGYWYIKSLSGSAITWKNHWGWSTAKPVPGDYDGDGKWDLAVFDTAGGYWYIKSLNGNIIAWKNYWGWNTAKPVSGDYDGDGKYDLAVYDIFTGYWYIKSVDDEPIAWEIYWGWPFAAIPALGD